MRLILLATLAACLFLSTCSDNNNTKEVELIPGPPGTNGHSLISHIANIPAGLLCENGGRSLDIYLDLDDSLTFSNGDEYLNSLVTCDGLSGLAGVQGEPGEQGPKGDQGEVGATGPQGDVGPAGVPGAQGPKGEDADVTIVNYSSSSCTLIVGSLPSYYAKSGKLYLLPSCSNSSKKSLSDGETMWVSPNMLASPVGSSIRVISFN